MRRDSDPLLEFVRRVGNVVDQFHRYNVPKELIESFQKSRLSSEVGLLEISQILSPLVDYLLDRLLKKNGKDAAPVRSPKPQKPII